MELAVSSAVDSKGRTQTMGKTIRTLGRLGIAWLAALAMLTAAHAQTAEQLRQLEQLSPAQRAQLLEALGQEQVTQQAPLPEPIVVNPRRVAQPPPTSTETEEGLWCPVPGASQVHPSAR